MQKTNAMRMLDKAKLPYEIKEYKVNKEQTSGLETATTLGINPEELFKTLVLTDTKNNYIVCCIPTNHELHLKHVAKAAKVKKIEMIPEKQLLPLTGYIRGGCSPIGMKKQFPTFIHESAKTFDRIAVSSGRRGAMLVLSPFDLQQYIDATFTDIIE